MEYEELKHIKNIKSGYRTIKEKDLRKLGFKKTNITKKESGSDAFSYYTLDIGDNYEKFCLITNGDEQYNVKLFNYDSFEFYDLDDLTIFIEILERISKKQLLTKK